MTSRLIALDKEKCSILANEIFLRISGVGQKAEKYEMMRKEAYSVRDSIKSNLKLKADYSRYSDFELDGETLAVGDERLVCKAFSQIDPKSIEEVFVYAVTADGFHTDTDNVLRQVYEDLWGTAYADAARKLLMQTFSRFYRLSEAFGPGFYGMDSAEMIKFTRLVDFEMIDVEVSDTGFLLPIKSAAGMIFIVNDNYKPVDAACQYCQGNKGSCDLCTLRYSSGKDVAEI